jgi:hypothetical protein
MYGVTWDAQHRPQELSSHSSMLGQARGIGGAST